MAERPVNPPTHPTAAIGPLLVGLLMVGLLWLSTAGAAVVPERGSDLDRWFDGELAPWLRSRLTEHPRLRGEALAVAPVTGLSPDPTPDALAAGLGGRLQDLLLDIPGVVMAKTPAPPDWQQPSPPRLDCRPSTASYLVAVEVAAGAGQSRVDVRILDLGEGSWVSGFGRSWRGRLSREERTAAARPTAEEALRGRRDLPFERAQPDLLAGRLAYSLGCGLLASPVDDPSVWVEEADGAGDYEPAIRLVGNYLARADLLRPAASRAEADLVLTGELHGVDGSLKQLWVSLRPRGDDGPTGVEAAAYVRDVGRPNRSPAAASETPARVAVDRAANGPALDAVRVLRLPRPCRPGDCDAVGQVLDPAQPLPAGEALALEAISHVETRVYLLELVPGRGLRRLAPGECGVSTGVDLRPGTRLRHPLGDGVAERTLFAVALRPGGEDRRLAELLGDVPSGCGVRPLQAGRLFRWLASFDAAIRGRDVEWQALRLTFDPLAEGGLVARER